MTRRFRHPVVILAILALVACVQSLVVGYTSGRQVAWLMWATLAVMIAAALALRVLLKRGRATIP
ncbi:MAG: hypothetical protein U5R48_15645 [Gammaproteobacteria bacterium]|nr:hypothetical protein [Gammaproteobacteria bacterium]